ncbi:GntR family transcriptional regulator [Glycomyces sp. L485]|uniref:GntR family transcriptional regulator n=1 Tax=Glycomyces sp. L485 TaxID=2909235 RepID=UPI001F4AD5FE|nr:GntR family transcriptional regulator [Glycomyces sp. L485]MCH7229606.1 GntR family transcriptional regulator [Glycomyces sp. L485]
MTADPDGRIDEMSPEPLYRQLAAILRARIERGDWQPRTPIPSESQLVDAYGVSRPTVRHAVAVLVDEGLVVTIPQRGSFVVGQDTAAAD